MLATTEVAVMTKAIQNLCPHPWNTQNYHLDGRNQQCWGEMHHCFPTTVMCNWHPACSNTSNVSRSLPSNTAFWSQTIQHSCSLAHYLCNPLSWYSCIIPGSLLLASQGKFDMCQECRLWAADVKGSYTKGLLTALLIKPIISKLCIHCRKIANMLWEVN